MRRRFFIWLLLILAPNGEASCWSWLRGRYSIDEFVSAEPRWTGFKPFFDSWRPFTRKTSVEIENIETVRWQSCRKLKEGKWVFVDIGRPFWTQKLIFFSRRPGVFPNRLTDLLKSLNPLAVQSWNIAHRGMDESTVDQTWIVIRVDTKGVELAITPTARFTEDHVRKFLSIAE
jgi:hypothetical protein